MSKVVPEEFPKIIKDFVSDLKNTFPEYEAIINKWWTKDYGSEEEKMDFIFQYCLKIFPERFFDILYKKDEIFSQDSDINTEFLPGISFKYLWGCEISLSTRDIIWKYLQMILISVMGTVDNKDAFGNSADMFKSMNEDDFKNKLSDTMKNMQSIFEDLEKPVAEPWKDDEPTFGESLPNEDEMHSNLNGLIGGKLGELAKEIAEETTQDLDIDMEGATNATDIFQKLFQNPGKLMSLVKTVGDKLDSKMKSGEMSQTELMTEATSMLNNMKKMPGMDNMQELFNKMGMGGAAAAAAAGLNKNTKIDTNAMNQKTANMKMKERLKKKAEERYLNQLLIEAKNEMNTPSNALTDNDLIDLFSKDAKSTQGKNKKKK
jgi:hypothetical protein